MADRNKPKTAADIVVHPDPAEVLRILNLRHERELRHEQDRWIRAEEENKQLAWKLAAAEAALATVTRERDEALALAERRRVDRAEALNVKSAEGLTTSEWILRTGKAEAEAVRLREALRVAQVLALRAVDEALGEVHRQGQFDQQLMREARHAAHSALKQIAALPERYEPRVAYEDAALAAAPQPVAQPMDVRAWDDHARKVGSLHACERLAEAARRLVDRLNFVHESEAYKSVWEFSQNHVGPYKGPQYSDELIALAAALPPPVSDPTAAPAHGIDALQARVAAWVRLAFTEGALADRWERAARVVEEAIELGQAEGLSDNDVYRLLGRVYDRPAGDVKQEAGGIMVCLLAWAAGREVSLRECAVTEIERIEQPAATERIRAKQAEKARAGTGHNFATAPALVVCDVDSPDSLNPHRQSNYCLNPRPAPQPKDAQAREEK